jgi:hypothetical protein
MQSNKQHITTFIVGFVLLFVLGDVWAGGQSRPSQLPALPAPDTADSLTADSAAPAPPRIAPADTARRDSLMVDSLATDSVKPKKKQPLQDVVTYEASDSVVAYFNTQSFAYLYGESVVKYQDVELSAEEIRMNLDSSTVYAHGVPDSTGALVGTPVFKDGSGEYESRTMNYNFKSQKGYITNIVTQQGEGYLTGGRTKKMAENEFYMENGKYTTCDHHDCPHFYLQLTKAKVKPKKNIVTGPAYLVLADVPLPLAIPFGYFPFTESYSSGIIMPTYGDELSRGFYLRDGGYYFAINDYVDLAATGEIFTKGSWGLNLNSNYAWRYKFSGSFNLGYQVTITGDKGLPDYTKMKNFKLTWSHSQDSKFNPNMTLSASVNFATSGYDRNNLDSYYNATQFTENTKSSTVNMTYNFPNAPISLSATANITQRSADSTLAVSFPDFTLNVSRIYPFKRKVAVGSERWYEKISMSYTGLFRNSITTKQDLFLKSSLIKDWKNGMQHSIPISSTFTILKYINVSPSISFVDRMYTNKVTQTWDETLANTSGGLGAVRKDTVYGFYNVYNFSFSVSANTKLYGFYKPLPFLGDKVQMIRHMFTPSISISGQPDFSKKFWGAWDSYRQPDNTQPEGWVDVYYSPFSNGMFGTAPSGKSGTISMSFQNNIEAKVKSDRDSTGVRKISLIDNLQIGGISYNFAADSLRWSDIPISIRLKLSQKFTLQMSGSLDSYMYSEKGTKINKTRWEAGRIPRLKSTSTSFSYTLNNDVIKKLFGGGDSKDKKGKKQPAGGDDATPPDDEGYQPLSEAIAESSSTEKEANSEFNKDGYMVWTVPWSLSINYGLRYGYGSFNYDKREYDRKLTQNLSFSGNISPTPNWSFNFSSSYDFDLKKISYMNCNITRDLHCWTMSAGIVPVGPYASYNFSIRVKSSLLSDLKYDKRSSVSNKLTWY